VEQASYFHVVKASRAQFGEKSGVSKHLYNCVIKHKLEVSCASFEENCAQTRTFSNIPFNVRRNNFLVHGTEKGFKGPVLQMLKL